MSDIDEDENYKKVVFLENIDKTLKEILTFFQSIEERTLDGIDSELYHEELEKDNFSPNIG